MSSFCQNALPCIKLDESTASTPADYECRGADSPVIRDLRNGLLVLYVVDIGEAFQFVQNRHLAEEGIDAEQLHSLSLANFVQFSQDRIRMVPHGNIHAIILDGNFEASVIILDSLWEGFFNAYAPNGVIVAVPARDILAFCDAGSSQGIKELQELISRVFPSGDHLISSSLFRRESGRWVRLEC